MRFVCLALALGLGGCGFHLEGSTPLPASLAVVQVLSSDQQTDFYFGLRKALLAAGTRIDDDGQDANTAVIHILYDSALLRPLTVSTLNVPTEYELTYKVRFSVTVNGKEVIAPEERLQVRDYSYSENAQLAKERENAILSQALAHDLVSVVMRRLASLSGDAVTRIPQTAP
jgi:LPS-assembly lipoprotein